MSDDTDEIPVFAPSTPHPWRSLAVIGGLVAFVALTVTVLVLMTNNSWRDEATSVATFPVGDGEEWTAPASSWTPGEGSAPVTDLVVGADASAPAALPGVATTSQPRLATRAPASPPAPAPSTAAASPSTTPVTTFTRGHGRPKPTKPPRT